MTQMMVMGDVVDLNRRLPLFSCNNTSGICCQDALKDCRSTLEQFYIPFYSTSMKRDNFSLLCTYISKLDRLCGLVVRVLGYRSKGPGFDSRAIPKKKSSESGMGSTQPREYN
jgi:hypothetical protein